MLPKIRYNQHIFSCTLALLCSLILAACRDEGQGTGQKGKQALPPSQSPAPIPRSCADCHSGLELDQAHALECNHCHQGNSPALDTDQAHADLVVHPAHPARMGATCGPCHQDKVQQVQRSTHLRLARMVNMVRQRFGAADTLDSLTAVPRPQEIPPDTTLALG